MATNNSIIRDALGLLGVLAETEDASAEQADHGLRILNDMMEDWRANGIVIGQWPQVRLTDTFPAPLSTHGIIKANLAIHLAPHYGANVSPFVLAHAGAGYSRLVRESVKANMLEADMQHLPAGEGHGYQWDITTDS